MTALRAAAHPAPTAPVVLDGRSLTLDQIASVARAGTTTRLTDDPPALEAIEASRRLVGELIDQRVPLYGITTGFGDSVKRQIDPSRARELQAHLVADLGNGTGATTPVDVARAVVLIRANTLARGHSGVRIELVRTLVDMLNAGITPVIPEEGSVGASGDLVPLSYVAAAVTGTRTVRARGMERPSADALREAGIEPLVLEPKEGLAIVNGTSFMTAFAALAAADAQRLALIADVCTAMATEALRGISGPFDPFLHEEGKPHPGQIRSARNIRTFLRGSSLARSYEDAVAQVGALDGNYREMDLPIQDQYSLRCAPQFVGMLWDTLEWVERWLSVEINSTNDNPLFDTASGSVFSGGNFSGGHVALAMDSLKTAVASVADLLDRQLALVVDEKFNRGLTPNLIAPVEHGDAEEGLNHGFKGMQLACSSLAAEALSKCMPLSAFSRSTECHNQDKVSMGSIAARQARDVVALTEKVAAIHLLALCQAADLRGPDGLGAATRHVYDLVRAHVSMLTTDRPMADDIHAVVRLLLDGSIVDVLAA